jgi:hypothetical protein
MELDQSNRQNFLEDDIKECAEYGPVDRPYSADKRDQHGIEGPDRRKDVLRVVTHVVVGEGSAGKPDQSR